MVTLTDVTEAWRAQRDLEIACRFGGEEFVILVPAAGLTETVALAERLRDGVSTMQVRYVDGLLPRVTISCGVSAFPDCGEEPAALLRAAPTRRSVRPRRRAALRLAPPADQA